MAITILVLGIIAFVFAWSVLRSGSHRERAEEWALAERLAKYGMLVVLLALSLAGFAQAQKPMGAGTRSSQQYSFQGTRHHKLVPHLQRHHHAPKYVRAPFLRHHRKPA